MSSGGYLSFAECIINRWTSRSALILGNGRNAESSVDTHIRRAHPLSSCCRCSGDVLCVWIFIAQCMYPLFVCSCVCMHVCLLYMRICGVCVCVCVAACVGQLCGRRIPLWPYPRFIDSHGVIWLRVNAWLSALYVQLQRGSRTTLFVLSCWISPQIKGCFTSFNRMNNKTQ